MKVLQYDSYGGPEVLHVAEAEKPNPAIGDVLVRVHASTVGWGDCKLRSGSLQSFYPITLPKIPGRYGCGIIETIGRDVTSLQVGQSVAFATLHTESGSAAEYVCLDSARLAPMPSGMTQLETGSMIQGAVSAYACLIESANASRGQAVLIHGAAGSVGSACVELARYLGCKITATCRAVDGDYVRSLGADYIVAFDQVDFSSHVKDQDVVVDLLGGEVHRRSYQVLKPGGRLVYLNAESLAAIPPPSITVFGVNVTNQGQVISTVCRLAEQGAFSAKVGIVVPLVEGARAHRLLEQKQIRRGRIVLAVAEL